MPHFIFSQRISVLNILNCVWSFRCTEDVLCINANQNEGWIILFSWMSCDLNLQAFMAVGLRSAFFLDITPRQWVMMPEVSKEDTAFFCKILGSSRSSLDSWSWRQYIPSKSRKPITLWELSYPRCLQPVVHYRTAITMSLNGTYTRA